MIPRIKNHSCDPKIVSQPFAKQIETTLEQQKAINHHWEDLVDVSPLFPNLPSWAYSFVESLSNILCSLCLHVFQVCCSSRNSFMAIIAFWPNGRRPASKHTSPILHCPYPVQQGGRAFLDRWDTARHVFSKWLPCSSLFILEDDNAMDVSKDKGDAQAYWISSPCAHISLSLMFHGFLILLQGLETGMDFPAFSDYQDIFSASLPILTFANYSIPLWILQQYPTVKDRKGSLERAKAGTRSHWIVPTLTVSHLCNYLYNSNCF